MERVEINSYRDLRVWQDAMNLAQGCFELTTALPKEELFGMSAQIRTATSSIAANIAEVHGREQTRSFIQFLRIAQGSLKELETHLLPAERVKLLNAAKVAPLLSECDALGRRQRLYPIGAAAQRGSLNDARPLTIHHSLLTGAQALFAIDSLPVP